MQYKSCHAHALTLRFLVAQEWPQVYWPSLLTRRRPRTSYSFMRRGPEPDQREKMATDRSVFEMASDSSWENKYQEFCGSVLYWVSIYFYWSFPGDSDVKKSACNAGDLGWSLGQEDPLEKEIATHSSIFAWRILMDWGFWWPLWQSMGSQESDTT